MTYYKIAIEYDSQYNIKEAVRFYRLSINNEEAVLDSYINLALILWDISYDYGIESYFVSKNIFLETEIEKFREEYSEVLNRGLIKFENSPRLKHWIQYIDARKNNIDITSELFEYENTSSIFEIFINKAYLGINKENETDIIVKYLTAYPFSYEKRFINSILQEV